MKNTKQIKNEVFNLDYFKGLDFKQFDEFAKKAKYPEKTGLSVEQLAGELGIDVPKINKKGND